MVTLQCTGPERSSGKYGPLPAQPYKVGMTAVVRRQEFLSGFAWNKNFPGAGGSHERVPIDTASSL